MNIHEPAEHVCSNGCVRPTNLYIEWRIHQRVGQDESTNTAGMRVDQRRPEGWDESEVFFSSAHFYFYFVN
jgi:hypothetical protein